MGGSEECDGGDLNSFTCTSRGYSSGIRVCTPECTFDDAGCVFVPGESGGGEEQSRECIDGIDNDDDGLVDFPEDLGCTNYLDDSELDALCSSNWNCDDWGECLNNSQIRACLDVNYCKSEYLRNETQDCESGAEVGGEDIKRDKIEDIKGFLLENRNGLLIVGIIVVVILIFGAILIKFRKKPRKRKRKKS